MKRYIFPVLIIFLFVTSCNRGHEPVLVTKKIQYDVNIKSPDPEYDWWIQNLVGPEREKIVTLIMEGAKAGKFKAYDYYYEPLTVKQVNDIIADTVAVKVQRDKPPYDIFDTLMIDRIENRDILRLRFMEEWRVNPKTLQFEKIVRGIAPVARRISQTGEVRWQPLFWIFPDDDFAKKLRESL